MLLTAAGAGAASCASFPCARGDCADATLGYTCACPAGWAGDNCETNINDCVTGAGASPCLNGAVCTDGLAKYTCACTGASTRRCLPLVTLVQRS